MAATYKGDSPSNPQAHDDGRETTATAANRREHVRVRPDDRNKLTATLASGSDIRLIDLSRGGAQFECERRFLPNASVSLRLRTRDGDVLVTGRVVRSRIVRLASGGLGYLVGVAFAKPLQNDFGDEPAAPLPTPAVSAPAPPIARPPSPPAPAALSAEAPVVDAAPADVETSAVSDNAAVPPTPVDASADISAEEALAFESGMQFAPAMLTVTASVDTTSDELQDMFNGNDW